MSRLERIVAAWGGLVYDGGRRALVRGPDHGPADRSVSLVETEEGRILIHCFSPKDDWRAVRDALATQGLLESAHAADLPELRNDRALVVQPDTEERQTRALRFWNESRAIRCTPASTYLKRRQIEPVESEELRFHPRMTSVDDRLRRPALMAAIRGSDGALQGVQATLLTTYGADKARVSTPRRVIGRLLGGAVQLAPARDVLIIAEGVESALSASHELEAPAWAALTAYNLSQFAPPESVSVLIAAPDNDEAGLRALDLLRARLSDRLQIEHAPAPAGLNDWNDWVRAHRA